MEYIVHHKYRGIAASGRELYLKPKKTYNTIGEWIVMPDSSAICSVTSENAHMCFSRNDDGKGMERGNLTHAIAYKRRVRYSSDGQNKRQRFTDKEIAMLERDWKHFLVPNMEYILFNDAFFDADPEELYPLAKALNIRV